MRFTNPSFEGELPALIEVPGRISFASYRVKNTTGDKEVFSNKNTLNQLRPMFFSVHHLQ